MIYVKCHAGFEKENCKKSLKKKIENDKKAEVKCN
jgi:hypothetical protein